jgi:microcin C transport system substrate-binding protein
MIDAMIRTLAIYLCLMFAAWPLPPSLAAQDALRPGLQDAPRPGLQDAPRHGLSVFGDLKYKPDFQHFDYVNPAAPKGGTLKLHAIGTFETLNPFILKGRKEGLNGLTFDTLMVRADDEPDALYGLVAKSAELAADKSWVAFNLDPRARFHDGTNVTAEDMAFTFDILVKKGHPRYRIIFRDVAKAEATGPRRIRFSFKPGLHRDLPTRLAALPVLSKSYYAKVKFDKTTFVAPLSSGPYRVDKVEPGRTVTYRRVGDYWARDLPVNRGRWNFDAIRVDYYRDRDVAFSAFFAGAYDFREEFTSRSWAVQYDKPPVRKRLIVRETLPDETPSGAQVFAFNLRRDKFKDPRVRQALNLAFDFEWTNKNLFFGLYDRTNSMFENSELAARQPPSPAERALLEPLRAQIPEQVFEKPYKAPVTDGRGNIRGNLRKAVRLLRAAGYRVKGGVLTGPDGRPFTIEFLFFEATFNRIVNPYIRNLERLGIKASIRIVDSANFKYRMDHFDFDAIVERYVMPLTPGVEQLNYFGSAYANVPGARNLSGIKDPAVDALIEKIMAAPSRKALVAAVRALDRVLMWNHFTVPQWYKGTHHVAYWNRFDRPEVKPKFARGMIDTWWYNPEKAAMIAAGRAPPGPSAGKVRPGPRN